MIRFYCIVSLLAASSLFALEPTADQIQSAKDRVNANPEAAKKEIEANPQLLDKLTPQQRAEVMDYIDSMSRSKSEKKGPGTVLAADTSADSVAARSKRTADSLRADSLARGLKRDTSKTAVIDTSGLQKAQGPVTPDSMIIFGQKLFMAEFMASEYADIPDNYVISPGDQILLRFWGRYNQERTYLIGKDGYVFIEPLNRQAYLIGMTYQALKTMVQRVSVASPGVEGDVRIVSAHPLYVHVAGNAARPGTISGPASYSFWQFLMLSKGPGPNGSFRDIRVSRDGKEIARLDLYDFLRTGRKPIAALRSEDLIFYGPQQNVVRVDGFVKRPGLYEMKNSERLGDLVEIAGGLRSGPAAPRIQIWRIVDEKEKNATGFPFKVIDVDLAAKGWEEAVLADGDLVQSKNMMLRSANAVYLMGSGIAVPGRYSLTQKSKTLSDLIKEAGGLARGAHCEAELLRLGDNGQRTTMPVNLCAAEALAAFRLLPHDSLVTYNDSQFVEITMVRTRGFVRKRIEQRYNDSLTLGEVLRRSEGIREGGLPYVYVKRTDDFGTISYRRFDASAGAAENVHIDKRDEILAFDFREFNATLPVTVLAYGKEPLMLDYSPDLTFDVVLHELGGLPVLIDSSRIEVCVPDFRDEMTYGTIETYALNQQTSSQKGIIRQGSIVFIRKDRKKDYGYFVSIDGEVMRPGRYPLLRRDSKLSELFSLCGGLTERANKWGIFIMREGRADAIPVEVKNKKQFVFVNEWILNSNDKVVVARNDYAVEVKGAVFDPRTVAYNPGYSCVDYIKKGAGGALDSADDGKTYIQYPNGIAKKAFPGFFSADPKIQPGCRIVVPFKPKKPPPVPGEKFDYSKFFTTVSASMITILSLVIIANQLK